jgi:lysozyme
MRTSEKGLAFIKRWEGERLVAYQCSANVWTVGVGHTAAMGAPFPVKGMKITADESDAIFRRDIATVETSIQPLLKVHVNQRQWDTIVSFVFNVGISAFRKSTLLKKLNASKYDEVPSELLKWVRANGKIVPGLESRRRAEADLWRGASTDKQPNGDMPQIVDPPRQMRQSKEGNAALFAGGLAGLNATNEALATIKSTHDSTSSFVDLLKDGRFLTFVAIALAAAAIWYWRKRRMDRDGY